MSGLRSCVCALLLFGSSAVAGQAPDPATPPPAAEPVPVPVPTPVPASEPEPASATEAEPDAATEAEPDAATEAEPALHLTPELQARTRGEMLRNRYPRVGQPVAHLNQGFVGFRVRGALSAAYDPITLRASAQGVGVYGDASVTNAQAATLGLHEGYLKLAGKPGSVTLGRQELNYGDQRLIGAQDWGMGAMSFDALKLQGTFGKTTLDLFGAVLKMPRALDTDTGPVHSGGDQLMGAYFVAPLHPAVTLELYTLYRHDGPNDADTARNRNVAAPGLRAHGNPIAYLGYMFEMTYQTGKVETTASPAHTHSAFAVTGDLMPLLTTDGVLSMWIGGAFATGESGDGSWNEFENFFPTNHKFYGAADLIGLRNLREGHAMLFARTLDGQLRLTGAAYLLGLADASARWSDAGGATVGQSATADSTWLGTEFDMIARYTPMPQLWVEGGYSIFIPETAAADRGHPDPTHYAYLWVVGQLP